VTRTPATGAREKAAQASAAELRAQIKERQARMMELYRTGNRDQLPQQHQILEQLKRQLQRVETSVPAKGVKGVPPRRRKTMAASDPQRTAEVLIKQLGPEKARAHAQQRAAELETAGDRAGTKLWRQILSSIRALEQQPTEGG
jgi:hypothetical protein